MKSEARKIVDKMLEEFSHQNIDAIVNTFSEDAVLVHHGTQIMPSAKFKGRDGARMFFEYNINALEVVYFTPIEFIEADNKVIILGKEHFISKENRSEMKNTWVQIYTVTNGLISKMEEFATSASPDQYGGNGAEA